MAGNFHNGAASHRSVAFPMFQRQLAFASIEIRSPFIASLFQHETDLSAFWDLRRQFFRHVRQREKITIFQNNHIRHIVSSLYIFLFFVEPIMKTAIQ